MKEQICWVGYGQIRKDTESHPSNSLNLMLPQKIMSLTHDTEKLITTITLKPTVTTWELEALKYDKEKKMF